VILILIGPQASGKGTQAKLLAKKLKAIHLETGSLFRQEAERPTPRGRLINKFTDLGVLVPDGIVIETVHSFIEQNGFDKSYVIDGYLRSIPQYKALKKFLKKHQQKIDLALYLDLDDQTAIKRLSSRLNCPKCGNIYNSVTNPPPQPNTCECGGKLFTRDDDQPAAVKTRLAAYHKSTEPLLDEFKKDGILARIDASLPIDQVFEQIIKQLPDNS
jgi:adenylate kinase